MKIHVDIIDDNGEIIGAHDADASAPSVWNAPSTQRFLSKMPQNASDVTNNGTYELFRITVQPIVRVDRPNGWVTPPPAPAPAIPLYQKQAVPWGTSSPTQAPNKAASILGAPPTRGY